MPPWRKPPTKPSAGTEHLAHRWRLLRHPGLPGETVREFLRPAVRAVPRTLAARFPGCCVVLAPELGTPAIASLWRDTGAGLEIGLATAAVDPHDLAMELLLCLGQALWEAAPAERAAYLKLLEAEIAAGVTGEIDEDAQAAKRRLPAGRAAPRSRRRLEDYARVSFASTVAEYVHCLWHDVTVRTGPEHLPPQWLRRRLEFFARWFPPDRGYRLFTSSSA